MELDPLSSLAISMQAKPGLYAILLGSGVSRSAQIPTGWEVILDLIRRVAAAQDEEALPDPEKWYSSKFGKPPMYGDLLELVARTTAERQQLLKPYFEPGNHDEGDGFRRPTAAHRSIATLVKSGYVRVILTTNFDRLMEQALDAEGINPTVISSVDDAKGAAPLVHESCTVLKVHGDYLDSRIRNTGAELESYEPEMNRLLDRVFDEYGIIVCGWSAEWDTALRSAMARCSTRRFSWYWAAKGELTGRAKEITAKRAAAVIAVQDADTFFRKLGDTVLAVEQSRQPHPISVAAAVALVKRYLSEPRYRIQLHDLVIDEAEAAYKRLKDIPDELFRGAQPGIFLKHVKEALEPLLSIMIHGCGLGTEEYGMLWSEALVRTMRLDSLGYVLRHYPVALLLYAGGISALVQGKAAIVGDLLNSEVKTPGRVRMAVIQAIEWAQMNEILRDAFRAYVPSSRALSQELREPLRRYVPEDANYENWFDRFEYLRSLVYIDRFPSWAPPGEFGIVNRSAQAESVASVVPKEAALAGSDWPWLRLFGNSPDRFNRAREALEQKIPRWQFF